MSRDLTLRTVPLLFLGLAAFSCGSDSGSEPESVVAPLEALEPAGKLERALAGAEGLAAIDGFALQASGIRYLPNEGFRPDSGPTVANTFARSVQFDLEADFLRVDTRRAVQFLFPGEATYVDILHGNVGTTTEGFFGAEAQADLPSDKAAAIRRQETLLNPHALVSRLMANGNLVSDGDEMLGGVLHHRLAADGDVYPMILWVDAATGQLSKMQTFEYDYYRRDVSLEVTYSGWQTTESGVGYPGSVSMSRAGQLLQEQDIAGFQVNPSYPEGTFDFPAGADPQLNADLYARGEQSHQWYFLLDSIGLPFSGIDTAITSVEVAPGVHQLQGGSHHSFVVEQAEGIVLVDAPLHDDRGAALAAFVASEFGKPITFVVASHFHEDHVSGIREVLGSSDAELVVHEDVADFWRELLSARSTLSPDSLSVSPRNVQIRTVPDDGELMLDDAEHPVALYDMNSGHADDLLLTRELNSNTVFVVDVYSPGNAAQLGAGDLDATLTQRQIPTDELKIVGGHGAEIHDYATLQTFL